MSILAKERQSEFIPAPEGTEIARCFAVIGLGTQPQNNPAFAPTEKVMVGLELPNQQVERDGKKKPMILWKEYSLSLSEKSTLRAHLESWRGRAFTAEEKQGFAVEKILDAPALVTIIHKRTAKGNTRADIASITRPPKDYPCPPRFNDLIHYEISMGKNDTFKNIGEWLQRKIVQCAEWTAEAHAHDDEPPEEPQAEDDGVPF